MKTIDLHLERKAFETYVNGCDVQIGDPIPVGYDYAKDEYTDSNAQWMWVGWQARARYEPTDVTS